MSNDLISRSAVIDVIKRHECDTSRIMEGVMELPTAYDVDKVVERLKLELNLADKEKERCARENPLQFDEAKEYARGMAVSMDIVKSGGIE